MARVLRVRKKPKNWSPGVCVAGVWLTIIYFITGDEFWWSLLIALVIVPIVDVLLSGTTKTEDIELTRE